MPNRSSVIFCVLFVISASSVFATAISCSVSDYPGGPPLTVIGDMSITKNIYWMNYSGSGLSTHLKFIIRFTTHGSPVQRIVQRFENVGPSFSSPFSIPFVSGNPVHGPAVLAVKDDFGKCTTPLVISNGAIESTDIPKNISDCTLAGPPPCIPAITQSQITISGFSSITKVKLYLWINHSKVSDLTVDLISPSATFVRVFNRHGGSGANLGLNSSRETILDDDAITPISAGTAPFEGSFTPDGPLSTFSGENPNGVWTLRVTDNLNANIGTIATWALEIADN